MKPGKKAYDKALTAASQDALKKGKHVLGSLDLKFKSIDEVVVGQRDARPVSTQRMMLAAESAGPDIEAGDVDVQAHVTLTLKYQ